MEKTELDREIELVKGQLNGCYQDLIVYKKYRGQSPVLDANIMHKEKQTKDLEERLKALEDKKLYEEGEQLRMI